MSSFRLHVGKIGENVAVEYLLKHGFQIIERNAHYSRLGEIDIVAKKGPRFYFVEVKSRSLPRPPTSQSFVGRSQSLSSLQGGKAKSSGIDLLPEQAVDERKQRKIINAAKGFLRKRHLLPEDTEWQIDVISVLIDWKARKAKVKYLPRAVFEE